MAPSVYRSLKEYMRASTLGSTRQELLKKLLTQAAQRKTQSHMDATGARMSTFPEMFGRSVAKNMGKQAFLGAGLNMAGRGVANFAGRQLSPALKLLQLAGTNAAARATRGGKRYLDLLRSDSLKKIVRQYGLAEDMRATVTPYSPRALQAMQAAGGSGFTGELATHLDDVARNLQHKGLGEAAKVMGTRTGTVGAGLLGGSAAINAMGQKQSMEMPQPSSRGETKKVTVPEASEQDPDCDPEGVQMTEKDHDMKKAEFNSKLKAIATGTYSTRYQKQAFMGTGAVAGLLTAPKGQSDLSVGRGALRGVGTALGAGVGGGLGALGGAGLGSLGGGLIGALAAALSKRTEGQTFGQAVGHGMTTGAATGGGLGYLAGIPTGAVYGGYKGNKATKALLDKTAPIDEDDKDDKDDEEKTKKSAAAVLAQLKKNQL
jgi:hypothetical protein